MVPVNEGYSDGGRQRGIRRLRDPADSGCSHRLIVAGSNRVLRRFHECGRPPMGVTSGDRWRVYDGDAAGRKNDALHEPIFHELAPAGSDFVALPRSSYHAAPALRNELGLDTVCLQPVTEPTVHPGYGEPHFGPVQLQQGLQLGQAELVFLNQSFHSAVDNRVEVRLHSQEYSERHVVLAHGGQRVNQMSVASPVGDGHRTFALRVPEGAPSAEIEQLLCDGQGCAVPGSLV